MSSREGGSDGDRVISPEGVFFWAAPKKAGKGGKRGGPQPNQRPRHLRRQTLPEKVGISFPDPAKELFADVQRKGSAISMNKEKKGDGVHHPGRDQMQK